LDVYLEVISKKTASLLEACCKAGALSGNADASGVKALGEFGLNLGIAFQIVDDILDFQGSADKMGKPKGEDLSRGIITLPVILLLKDGKYGGPAKDLLSDGRFNAKSVAALHEMLFACDAAESSWQMAWSYIGKAQTCLEALPQSESRTYLHDLASALRQREK
jgi:heptaprenyl diphosphate synthase